MFNKLVATSASSPLLLKFVTSNWFAFSTQSFTTMNTSFGSKFPTIIAGFNGQIPQALNLNIFLFFFKDYSKALTT